MRKPLGLFVALCLLMIFAPAARAQLPAERMVTLTLPAPQPDWLYALDIELPSLMVGRVVIYQGAALRMRGLVSAGYLSNFELSPDGRELYTIDTFYSRGAHGDRTDVVTIHDAQTLAIRGEVVLPPKRLLMLPKIDATALTSDGRFLLVSNMTPATSVSVVDLKAHKFAGEIETPGCTQVLAAGNRRFASMCADGSLMVVDLNEAGGAAAKKQGAPFFSPQKDPVFDQPMIAGSTAYFVSFSGLLYAVDLAGSELKTQSAWTLVDASDRAKNWRPGGWQMLALDSLHKRGYVLMHQGGENTYKQEGTEVWAFDLAAKHRIGRFKLRHPAYSIRVAAGDPPLLFTASLDRRELQSYSLTSGELLGHVENLQSPSLLYGP